MVRRLLFCQDNTQNWRTLCWFNIQLSVTPLPHFVLTTRQLAKGGSQKYQLIHLDLNKYLW